ncbi:TIR domain-containing protein [Amycolatopsis alkalitolerans]|uniref:TIR domain-containing protein n=1 Tax=Amycolatopsis alkalitolerans TaxID=2547244 RepID=A0A5C4M3Q0_9PSEU|nr:TIR domain-containing protein [Amycolatopsis alkalitolerans]TNC27693.1 TIR domain-containing protein [Amycolatopsis alkalitolerans]
MNDAAGQTWDVFVSHGHADEAAAATVAAALTEAGLRVFRAVGAVNPFTSISDSILRALRASRVLLACYSADYPTRSACQYEFATAYLTGQAEGDPLRRAVAINLERTVDHIEPRHLRDVLLPPASASLDEVVKAVADRLADVPGPMGEVPERPPRWLSGTVIRPLNDFVGRWRELWWLHSALHPDVGPLTTRPSTPVVVVHGPAGIGKTALAAQYVRRFGAAFSGIVWRSATRPAPAPPGTPGTALWVLDDAEGDFERVLAHLPPEPGKPCLVLTRDPRLAAFGNALALDDLDDDESAHLLSAHGLTPDTVTLRQLTQSTAGSPYLRSRIAELAARDGVDTALTRLHQPASPLLSALTERLTPVLDGLDDNHWDVLRVLAAAAPTKVSLLHVADIVGSLHGTERLHEFVPVQHAATDLLARGVVAARPDAVELTLPNGLVLALRRLDADPYRAELIRARTIQWLTQPHPAPSRAARPGNREQARAAHRIQTELLHRITGHPLTDDEGSLRDALTSLYELLKTTRSVYGDVPPHCLHTTTSGADLSVLVHRLINDTLRSRLTHWHVDLAAHEDLRPGGVSRIEHERLWPHNRKLREELHAIHREALDIADQLALIADQRD